MSYSVEFRYWQDGSGYSNLETFECLDEFITAEEYIKWFNRESDCPITDTMNVEIYEIGDEDSKLVSEYFYDPEEMQ